MASDSERTEDAPWDELERGFFAAAPPDVPVPPPEPMRFDDLDPLPSEIPQRRRAVAARRLAAWRASSASSAAAAWRRLTPAVGTAWRRVTPAVGVATVVARRSATRLTGFARTMARAGQAQMPRLLAVFQNSSRRTRVLAAGVAALVAVTGVSVASRGSGGGRALPTIHAQAAAIASSRTVASENTPPPVAMTLAPDDDPRPASASIATSMTTPAPRKRKHAKAPRQPARAKTLSKSSNGPGARPTSGR